jgi:long-chain acyl-CoA synthetase
MAEITGGEMTDRIKGSDKPWIKNYKLGAYPLKQSLVPYPEHPVFKLLDDTTTAFPSQIAIEYLGHKIRYSELSEMVNRLANAFIALGVKKGDKVAVVLPNCPQFIITDFATMKAGATVIPCSSLHKSLDLKYEIGESGATTVVCSDENINIIKSLVNETKVKNIIVTSPLDYAEKQPEISQISGAYQFRNLVAENSPESPRVEINAREDLAHLAFTGGATGVPKGVMITHFGMVANTMQTVLWMLAPIMRGLRGKSSVEMVIPLFHAYGHNGMLCAVAAGLRILLVSDPRDTDQTVNLLREHRPLMAFVVPTHLMRLVEKKIGRLPVMFISGAAPLPREIFDAIKRDIMMPVTEGYGLTECGPATHINLSNFSKITGFVSQETFGIGLPLPDTEVQIINPETGEELGAGVSGEIIIRGPQIMKGYWPKPGSGLIDGWLHTGDIGRMDENGYFVLEDRIKDMANISGYKVYTTEIDNVIFKYPGVSMVAVVGIPDPERMGSERLKAFVRLKEEYKDGVKAEDIIAYCKEKLPPYAVPKWIEFRNDLPLTVTEKIFKRALREEEIKKMKENSSPEKGG